MKQNVTEIKLLIQNNSNASSVSNYTHEKRIHIFINICILENSSDERA